MPKKQRTETVSGKLLVRLTGAASGAGEGCFTWRANPTNQTWAATSWAVYGQNRLAALADLFQFFRFTELALRIIHPNTYEGAAAYATTLANTGVSAYSPTLPANLEETQSMPSVGDAVTVTSGAAPAEALMAPSVTTFHKVPQAVLSNPQVPWFRCVPGSVDDALEYQSNVSLGFHTDVASQSVTSYLEIKYTCQFKDFIVASLTPLAKQVCAAGEEEKRPDPAGDLALDAYSDCGKNLRVPPSAYDAQQNGVPRRQPLASQTRRV